MCRFSFYLPFVGPTHTHTAQTSKPKSACGEFRRGEFVSAHAHLHLGTSVTFVFDFLFVFSFLCWSFARSFDVVVVAVVVIVLAELSFRSIHLWEWEICLWVSLWECVRERERARKQWFQSGFKFLSTCVCFLTVQLRLLVCFDFGLLAARNLCAA